MNRRTFFETVAAVVTSFSLGEIKNPNGSLILNGLLTENGHKYPQSSWDKALAQVDAKKSLAIFCPMSVSLEPQCDLRFVAGRITNLRLERVDGLEQYRLYGKVEVMVTPAGKDMLSLNKSMFLTPVGFGTLNGDLVSNYDFGYWNLTTTSSFVGAEPVVNMTSK